MFVFKQKQKKRKENEKKKIGLRKWIFLENIVGLREFFLNKYLPFKFIKLKCFM